MDNEKMILNTYRVLKDCLEDDEDLSLANMVQNGIIKEVAIGPKSDIRKEDLYYYMIVNGYETDVNIRKSDASYR